MKSFTKHLMAAACSLALFSVPGCSEVELTAHLVKQIPGIGSKAQSQGEYKIGKPYKINGTWYYPKEDFGLVETGIASWYGPGFHGKKTANGEIFDTNQLTAAHRTLQLPALVRVTNLENGRAVVVRINDRGPFARGRIIDVSRRAAELLGFKNQGTARVRVEVLREESIQLAEAAKRGQDTSTTQLASLSSPSGNSRVTASSPPPDIPPPSITARAHTQNASVTMQNNPQMASVHVDPVEAVKLEGSVAPSTSGGGVTYNSTAQLDAPPVHTQVATASYMPEPVVTQYEVTPTQIFVQAGAFTVEGNAERLKSSLSSIAPVQIQPAVVNGTQFFRVRLGPLNTVDQADVVLARVFDHGHNDARIIVTD